MITSAATRRHVHEGETTANPQSSYYGKWNGKGLHDWEGVQKVIVRDGFFEATVHASKGTPIRVQGWFKEDATGNRTITSHAPRYDKRWPVVGSESW